MAGRPKYKPTQSDRDTVKAMSAAGIPHESIAKCLGTNGIAENTMRLHFRREIDTSRDLVTGMAMGQLVQAVSRGEAWAICFWMKCRAGWQERQVMEHTTPEGTAPVRVDVRYVDKPYPD
jgi:hypothetical protein